MFEVKGKSWAWARVRAWAWAIGGSASMHVIIELPKYADLHKDADEPKDANLSEPKVAV